MRNLIPHFISEKYSRNECEGSFKASILFLDISGFTAMTESLMCEGKESEEINRAVLSCEIWQINKSEEHKTVAFESSEFLEACLGVKEERLKTRGFHNALKKRMLQE